MESTEGRPRHSESSVNLRLQALFEDVVTVHEGGIFNYPIGGDSDGYGSPDYTLDFLARLQQIDAILRRDKQSVISLVEGRGVLALALCPKAFTARKRQNMRGNLRRSSILQRAKATIEASGSNDGVENLPRRGENVVDEAEGLEAAEPCPAPNTGRKRKQAGFRPGPTNSTGKRPKR